MRYNRGKLRWNLLPWEMVEHVVAVYTYGGEKYEDWNWTKLNDDGVTGIEDCFAAIHRHLIEWRKGNVLNTRERNLPHMAQVIWNALAIMHYQRTQLISSKKYDFSGVREEFEAIREKAREGDGSALEELNKAGEELREAQALAEGFNGRCLICGQPALYGSLRCDVHQLKVQ